VGVDKDNDGLFDNDNIFFSNPAKVVDEFPVERSKEGILVAVPPCKEVLDV
jgi:hypothetical protein